MKKSIVFGTFDIIHPGHLNLFRQAKEYGEFLVAVVARDNNVEKVKGKKSVNDEKKRLANISSIPNVDLAVLGDKEDPYLIIEMEEPDFICLGYDQNSFDSKLEDALKRRNLDSKIVRLKPYKEERYKSSKFFED